MNGDPLRLYVHIPFCSQKCPYCHFYSIREDAAAHERFVRSVCAEIDLWKPSITNAQIVSVYFGGGTPFLLGSQHLASILTHLASLCELTRCEITIETNPETTTIEELRAFRALGVNRVSIGVQSFNDRHLRVLQRRHTASDNRRVIEEARSAGFTNISIDLMYDLPDQTIEEWQETLTEACSLPINHLSLYNLTIEPATPWFRKKQTIEAQMPCEETSLQMYETAQAAQQRGFVQYEISAFAQPGYHSRHNVGYWQGNPFLGFGPSAFSFFDGKRFSNIANLNEYCTALASGSLPVDFVEEIDPAHRLREMVAIGLRMNEGICLATLEERWGRAEQSLRQTLNRFIDLQLLAQQGPRLSLTPRGRILYDSLVVDIV
jgi:oxygen-independent coproporphyrinogen-3 oxidase